MTGDPIVVQQLIHRYPRAAAPAVEGLSLTLRRGEILGLLGPNGAGKTTTLHAILGLLEPTGGRISVFGASPLTQRTQVLPRLNFASVDVDLPSNLTVGECLLIFAKLYGVPNASARIRELAEQFDVLDLRRHLIGTLSAGERMRVKLCKALLNHPELLILDEPTLSLDPYMAQKVRDLLKSTQRERGMAILHTSHNMQEVEAFCDRIIFLHRGRNLAEGSPREVLTRFKSRSLDELFIRVATSGELCSGWSRRTSRQSLTRILAVFQRSCFLYRRSLVRAFDVFFWPVMELLIWGFVTLYIQRAATGPLAEFIIFLIGAVIFWDILYRGQLAVAISLMEEIWTRNIVNVLISPIRMWEWIAGNFLYAAMKVAVIALLLSLVASAFYAFNLARIGWAFLPLTVNLLIFGWTIGIFTAGLLLRFGYAAEALIWGIPFLVQPFSCVFYPLEILPAWARLIAGCLPSTYIFEGLRTVLREGEVPWTVWPTIVGLNVLYGALGTVFFLWMFHRARATGHLGHLGQD